MKNKSKWRRRRRCGLERAVERRGSETQSIGRQLVGARGKSREAKLAAFIGPSYPSLMRGRIFRANGGPRNRSAGLRLNDASNGDGSPRGGILLSSRGRCDGE